VAGVHGETGEKFDEASFCSELLEGMNGIEIEIPDDVHGGKKKIIVEIHHLWG